MILMPILKTDLLPTNLLIQMFKAQLYVSDIKTNNRNQNIYLLGILSVAQRCMTSTDR